MDIPDKQEIVLVWNGKPIGKIFSRNVQTHTDGAYTIIWEGTCLGEEVMATSYGEAVKRMMMIADDRNLQHTTTAPGYGVDTLYIPPYEE